MNSVDMNMAEIQQHFNMQHDGADLVATGITAMTFLESQTFT
jgi:hypothetical protein